MLHSLKKAQLLSVVFFLALLTGVVSGCTKKDAAGQDKIKITATTDFYGEVARSVAGKKGTVTSVINKPNVDPHDYEPTPQVSKTVAGSQIVIANGIGYDAWMNKLVKNDDSNAKYIRVGEDLMGKKSGDNPHLWYDPQTMPKLAQKIAQELGKKQPKNKAYFKKNAQKYIKSLHPINKQLTQLKKTAATAKNKEVYVSEPVFDYAIKSMGFKVGNQAFENAIEKGTDPSPRTLSTLQKNIRQKKIAFFVYNSQVSDKTVTNLVKLAKENQVPVLKVTETLPAHKNYRQWMTGQYANLLKILDNQ